MFFSRAILKRKRLPGLDLYAEHKLIWELFGDDEKASRDFLYRRADSGEQLRFYLLSHREPRQSELWSVETKEFDPLLNEGRQLAFNLRVNPVIRRRTADGKQKRDDVVMDTRHQIKAKNADLPGTGQIVEEAGRRWLLERSEKLGFSVDPDRLLIENYFKMESKKHGTNQKLHFGVIDYSGTLSIVDSEAFRNTLFQGIGPAKAFGCGLLLVKPAPQ